jgi:hypothetical protein
LKNALTPRLVFEHTHYTHGLSTPDGLRNISGG